MYDGTEIREDLNVPMVVGQPPQAVLDRLRQESANGYLGTKEVSDD